MSSAMDVGGKRKPALGRLPMLVVAVGDGELDAMLDAVREGVGVKVAVGVRVGEGVGEVEGDTLGVGLLLALLPSHAPIMATLSTRSVLPVKFKGVRAQQKPEGL